MDTPSGAQPDLPVAVAESSRVEMTCSREEACHTPTKPKINNLPGKKPEVKITKKQFLDRVHNKCAICKTIFQSKKDKEFQRKHKKNGQWLGCDEEGCHYWAHAFCAGKSIPSRKSAATVPFFCPNHSSL